MTPLTSATEIDIRAAFRNLCGSGVPEEHLADMLATHAIGLLENQRPEWFGDVPRTPETVLRGMIVSYGEAVTTLRAALWSGATWTRAEDTRLDALDHALTTLHNSRGAFLAGPERGAESLPTLGRKTLADYEARLSGARPIDAPPADKDPAT